MTLAVIAVVGFTFFLIWELTEAHPVVDLRLFARRNFTMGAVTMAIAYGVFFGNIVLLPLWLQTQMGYTATEAGFVLAPVGLLAILMSPIIGKYASAAPIRAWIASVSLPAVRADQLHAFALQHAGRSARR